MIYVYALEVPGEVKGGRKRFGAAASCATEGPLSGNDRITHAWVIDYMFHCFRWSMSRALLDWDCELY